MANTLAAAGNTFNRIGSSERPSLDRCFSNTNYRYEKESNIGMRNSPRKQSTAMRDITNAQTPGAKKNRRCSPSTCD
jgi:hypothetical protein